MPRQTCPNPEGSGALVILVGAPPRNQADRVSVCLSLVTSTQTPVLPTSSVRQASAPLPSQDTNAHPFRHRRIYMFRTPYYRVLADSWFSSPLVTEIISAVAAAIITSEVPPAETKGKPIPLGGR